MQSVEQTKAGIRFKPPKNGRSRAVTLPAFAVVELRRLKREQAEQLLSLGVRQSPVRSYAAEQTVSHTNP